jgi:ATP synthase protein I
MIGGNCPLDGRVTMDKGKRQLYRSLGFLSSMGISMVAATLIGLAMGYYLDLWLGTSPWLTLLFLGFGIAAGFRNVFILTSRELKRQQEENHGSDENP